MRSQLARARAAAWWRAHRPEPGQEATARYVAQLDLDRMRELGSDYFNPRYSPERVGKPLDEIDRTYDYDFDLVDETYLRLRHVDRHAVLRHVFAEVIGDASEPTERHLALLAFLQQLAFHNPWVQPVHRDRSWVCDPLVLLELNEMRCGSVSMLAVDLFRAGGYDARLVAVGGHTLAEAWYEGAWHYFDADLFGGGQVLLEADGRIPSVVRLAELRDDLDRLGHSLELNPQLPVPIESRYPSSIYFSRATYGEDEPAYLAKRATPVEERASRYFGWEGRRLDRLPAGLELDDEPIRPLHEPPSWESVELDGAELALRWSPVDGASAYRLLLAPAPRGWNPGADGWRTEDYDTLFRPSREGRVLETADTSARVELDPGRVTYVSVSSVDPHGAAIGKETFFAFAELAFRT